MYAIIGLIGFLGFLVFLIRLIIHAAKRTPMKSDKAGMLLCVAVCCSIRSWCRYDARKHRER